ncbi:MAG: elongation factor P [Spirochaetales bacterium]|nr:elongation factor P [Spirochaetales bacterium]
MVKAGSIEKGMYILLKDEPHLVTEREFVKPGKGQAFVRVKLKNVKTGLVQRPVIKSHESVEEIVVEEHPSQYLYADESAYHFMDTDTYEQFEIPMAGFEEKKDFMKEGDTYDIVMWESIPLGIKIPLKETYTVSAAEDAVKGDTVTGATKTVVCETGLQVKVPIFIKSGDKILVNTDTGEYVERVNT